MDLNTAKGKLNNNEYYSVSEVLADLRIIWDNCRQFNAEGSDILNMAENCSALLESLVEVSYYNACACVKWVCFCSHGSVFNKSDDDCAPVI